MRGPRTILITGGAGNLGTKLTAHLSVQPWCDRIIVLDAVVPPDLPAKAEAVVADLADPNGGWRDAVAAADGIVHMAVLGGYPGCGFANAATSFAMTANLFLAAAEGAARVVFASSNHVMGRYKEEALGPGQLRPDLPPLPGTRFIQNGVSIDTPDYASAKLMGERLLAAIAGQPGARLTGVALRVGWCQRGENHPRTMSPDGLRSGGPGSDLSAAAQRDLTWFRDMWLSNRDLCAVFTAALTADAAAWPARLLVLNAMSANSGMPWDIEPTRRYLGYEPQDDAWVTLG